MRRAARKDANHNDIGDHLRSLGWSVLDLSRCGEGIPDIVVGKHGFACLVEIKDGSRPPSERKLTEKEQKVRDNWTGPYVLATSLEDAEVQLALLLAGRA